MPSISTDLRIVLGIVAAIAALLSAAIGNVLAINIVYFFTKRGKSPTKRPIRLWIIFYFSAFVSVVIGSFATFAPTSPIREDDGSAVATITPIPLTPTPLPTETREPVLFKIPSINEVISGYETAGYSKQAAIVRDSQGTLTLFLRNSLGDLAFVQSSDGAVTWSEPNKFYNLPPPGGPGVSAVVDSADQVHLVWGIGPQASDVHYGLLAGNEWRVFDEIVGTGSFARDIAVDSANHPHIAWSGIGIFHLAHNGTNWVQPPESILQGGWHPDIQINSQDKVFLFLNDGQFYPAPGNVVVEIDNVGGHWNDFVQLSDSPFWSGGAAAALDSQGNIYVAWMGATTVTGGQDQVFFSRFIGGEWQAPFPLGNVNTSAGSTGQESPVVAFDSNDVFYVFWRGLNSDNHPVIFARALATENSKVTTVTQGWSPLIELLAKDAADVGWPSATDVWMANRVEGIDLVWAAIVGTDQVVEYTHITYP